MKRPFFKSGIIGIGVIIFSLTLMKVFPSQAPMMPDGFVTPILAYEFIRTPREVQDLFGEPGSDFRASMVEAMNLGNRLDYGYMVLYSLFLFTFSVTCARIWKRPRYYLAGFLSLLLLLGDAMENVQLLGIADKLATGGFERELQLLFYFTWLKWGGLGLVFLILAFHFFSGSLASKLIGLLGVVTFLLAVVSFFNRSVANEIFGLATAVMFLMMIIYALTHRRRETIII